MVFLWSEIIITPPIFICFCFPSLEGYETIICLMWFVDFAKFYAILIKFTCANTFICLLCLFFIVCVVTSIKTLWVIKCFWEKYTPFIFSHAKLVSLLLVLATIYFYILSDISLLSSAEKILLCKILLNDLEVHLGDVHIWSHTIVPFNFDITSGRPLEANINLHSKFLILDEKAD